jgi:hypothetical protein
MALEANAMAILRANAVMAIATVESSGWPQNTMVSYVSDGLLLYFLISRSSRKFANLQRNDRVSIAIGGDFVSTRDIQGLSIAARAVEVRHEPIRSSIARRLAESHGGIFDPDELDYGASALFRARPSLITVVDFGIAAENADRPLVEIAALCEIHLARGPNWGPDPALVDKGAS